MKTRPAEPLAGSLVLVSLLTINPCELHAAPVVARWVGTASGNWSDPANWDIGRVPRNLDAEEFEVVWEQNPVAVTLDVTVSVSVFRFSSGGTLIVPPGSTFRIEQNLTWRDGTFSGGGTVSVQQRAAIFYIWGNERQVLDGCTLSLHGATELSAVLELRHEPANNRFARVVNEVGATFSVTDASYPGAVSVWPGPQAEDIRNLGRFRIENVYWPCEAGFRNCGRVEVVLAYAEWRATFVQDFDPAVGQEPSLLLADARMSDDIANPPVIAIRSGRLEGQYGLANAGVIGAAEIGSPGAGREAVLTGNIDFGRLRLLDTSRTLMTLSGSDARPHGQFGAQYELQLGGVLEVRFADGFEEVVNDQMVFPILSCAQGVGGEFRNVALGSRVATSDQVGTFLFGNLTPNILALSDFQPTGLFLDLEDNALVYRFPPDTCVLAPNPRLRSGPEVSWDGGELELNIASGYVSAEDQWDLRHEGVDAGQLGVGAPDPGGAIPVSYGGVPVGTARKNGSRLNCTFAAAATGDAIAAVLRNAIYTNQVFGGHWFTDPAMPFPPRTVQLSLTNHAGLGTNLTQSVIFPQLAGIELKPAAPWLLEGSTERVWVWGTFQTGEGVTWAVTTNLSFGFTLECSYGGISARGTSDSRGVGHLDLHGILAPEACWLKVQAGTHHAQTCVRILSSPCSLNTRPNCSSAASVSPPGMLLGGDPTNDLSRISLPTFHALEKLMTETEEGRRLAGLYWRHTAEVLTLLLEHPGLLDEANALVAAFQPAVAALLSGQGTNAIITQSMIDQLNSVWTQLVGYASPGLQSNLLAEWARFHGFQDFVDKDFSQWAALLEIPVPAQPWIHLSNPALRDGRFSIRANQVSGVELSLWRSANLTHWERAPASQVQISLVEEYTAELTDLSPPPGRTFYQVRARLLSPGAQTRR